MGSQTFKKETMPIHDNLFQKQEQGELLSEWFYETSAILTAKPKKTQETTAQTSS